MSRSMKKHIITKFGCKTRDLWKEFKTSANRYNRRKAKEVIFRGEEILPKARKLCSWDYEFCRWHFTKDDADDNYRLRRK